MNVYKFALCFTGVGAFFSHASSFTPTHNVAAASGNKASNFHPFSGTPSLKNDFPWGPRHKIAATAPSLRPQTEKPVRVDVEVEPRAKRQTSQENEAACGLKAKENYSKDAHVLTCVPEIALDEQLLPELEACASTAAAGEPVQPNFRLRDAFKPVESEQALFNLAHELLSGKACNSGGNATTVPAAEPSRAINLQPTVPLTIEAQIHAQQKMATNLVALSVKNPDGSLNLALTREHWARLHQAGLLIDKISQDIPKQYVLRNLLLGLGIGLTLIATAMVVGTAVGHGVGNKCLPLEEQSDYEEL